METKYTKDAIYICRLMFGQAVLELLADNQPVTNRTLEAKIKVMLPDAQPALIYKVALDLLNENIS
ncbi:hypothetical protein F3I27_01000 [Pantoea sp. Bo_2]|uniref:Uncharacterized protein n=1 Tax=Candidatus Pantoea gossypiicola TaxID=2608008 RepID=A0AB34CP81_9GAMM|nr:MULTISPECIES: hypothetical protein [Pantoea]KAA5926835.1 hypothetical protein F3I59_18320 [Pantoea sp. VH_8]KAA5930680.1 hypothetical protein F3I58_18400 [Pantoea sp. VH_4]KAA5950878.1 hypothetical protein F3I57_00330 [Pantoea sp. VH_3]KAA5956226.1 hypothetical protein F3I56_02000 [Pantoea sp. VH_25]KAA5959245.1 hypothetical protein F3I55_03945 [Pantoea sp. VH_24]